MSIKRYVAEKDTTITNAYNNNLITRAYNANMGASDSLEIFSIYGQAFSSSAEQSRILIQFPIEQISDDRDKGAIPADGDVRHYLRLFNVKHPYSVPRGFSVDIMPISGAWDEGSGLDMETYTDYGWNSTYTSSYSYGNGATWIYPLKDKQWSKQGGDYSSASYLYNYEFKEGTEDLEVDVTDIVEDWIAGTSENNGFVVKLSDIYEDGTMQQSFFTKKFSARGSEFFYKRPVIETRWEAINTDDRNNFYSYSEALSENDNKMNIYFYNKVNGKLKNIVNNIVPEVKFYSNSNLTSEVTAAFKEVSNPSVGVYKSTVIIDTTSSVLYDKWYNTSSNGIYFQGSFDVLDRKNYDFNDNGQYVINITNNKLDYLTSETVRFKIFIRERDWQPTIYTVAYNTVENTVLTDLYYKIFRLNDNYTVIDYSTGSLAYTKTSYDSNGNYFDLDMSILQPGYTYGIRLARWDGASLQEAPTTFKFKVG